MKKILVCILFLFFISGCQKKITNTKAREVYDKILLDNVTINYDKTSTENSITTNESVELSFSKDDKYLYKKNTDKEILLTVENNTYIQITKNTTTTAVKKPLKAFSYDFNELKKIELINFFEGYYDISEVSSSKKKGVYQIKLEYSFYKSNTDYELIGEYNISFNDTKLISIDNVCDLTYNGTSTHIVEEMSFNYEMVKKELNYDTLSDCSEFCYVEKDELTYEIAMAIGQQAIVSIDDGTTGALSLKSKILKKNNECLQKVGTKYYLFTTENNTNYYEELTKAQYDEKYAIMYDSIYPFMAYLNTFKESNITYEIDLNNNICIKIEFDDSSGKGYFDIYITNNKFTYINLKNVINYEVIKKNWSFNYTTVSSFNIEDCIEKGESI